jgi:hypothetical protein
LESEEIKDGYNLNMTITLTKTDYILYRECPQNVWYKIHRPDIYSESELSEFEKSIMETGNEVELIARKLFPGGVLIERRDEEGQKVTQDYIAKHQEILFQPVFVGGNLLAAIDVLKFNPESGDYFVYEIKSTSDVDNKTHYHDLAFQVNLLRKHGLQIDKANIIHLNSEYVRTNNLDVQNLFKIVDVTSEVESLTTEVSNESQEALEYLSQETKPNGYCCCVYKGRSKHCSTFQHSNPEVPEYSVHDIARIGNSKAKLKELIDNNIFHLDRIPAHVKLTDIQQGQVDTYVLNKVLVEKDKIKSEFDALIYPLYFLDYETFPAAIPRFNGFSPYHQIPFQYSVDVVKSPEDKPEHFEFLYIESDDPSVEFSESLKKHLGSSGSIVVWHKGFECGRNDEIANRIPVLKPFMDSLKSRIYDLEDIFRKQYHIHRDFRGGTSIKRILPVLVPGLSYKDLEIRDGGSAADTWNKIVSGNLGDGEREKAINNLKIYCGLDTYAMYSIWLALYRLL